MKILFVTPLYPPEIGGPATYAQLLAHEIPKQGIGFTVVKFSDVAMLPTGIRHIVLFLKILWLGFFHDIIFAQDVFSVGFPAAFAVTVLRKPFIVRVPGDYAWEQGAQKFGIHESVDQFQIKKYGWKIEFMRSVQKFVVRSAQNVIAPSHYFAQVVQGWLPQGAKKVIAMYNGIDNEKMMPYQKNDYRIHDKKTIIAAGRMVPWKEFDALIKLLGRHASWNLILVGDGPEKKYLQKLAKSLGVLDRVHFKGTLEQNKLWECIAHADVFVLNSSFESFSYQAVEAMAIGTPLITTDACNMQEVVTSEESGIIISAKNDEELERALVQLLGNQAMRENIGRGGIKKALDFSVEKLIERLLIVLTAMKVK